MCQQRKKSAEDESSEEREKREKNKKIKKTKENKVEAHQEKDLPPGEAPKTVQAEQQRRQRSPDYLRRGDDGGDVAVGVAQGDVAAAVEGADVGPHDGELRLIFFKF